MKMINGFPNCPDDPDWDRAKIIIYVSALLVLLNLLICYGSA